jgi:hypothetical protein
MAFDPVDPQIAYVAGTKEIRKSTAGGVAGTWASIGPPAVVDNVSKIAVAKSAGNVIYALESSWAASGKVYVTTNSGANWSTVDLQAPYPLDIDVHPQTPGRFVVGLAFDLLLCENYGATCQNVRPPVSGIDTGFRWVRFNTNAYVYMAGGPVSNATLGNELYVGTDLGVFVSPDLGVTWKRLGHNFPMLPVLGLKWSSNGRLYASTNSGLYSLRNDQYGQPAVPVMAQPVNEPSGVRIRWSAVSGATQYRVFRGDQQIFIGESIATNFLDTKVSRGAQYCYSVDAFNQQGFSVRATVICTVAQLSRSPSDLNGDGKSDLLLRNSTTGLIAGYLTNGITITNANALIGPGGWTATHTADINGDGKADILWRNTDGTIAAWLMNGLTPTADAVLSPGVGWRITHTADLDGDGKADILWQHTDGRVAAWIMDGLTPTGGAILLGAGTGFSISHMADLNGDGKADILWRHTDGRVATWIMNGLTPTTATVLLGAGTGFGITHTADLDGDGKVDILWANGSGVVTTWLMDGVTQKANASLMAAGAGWSITRTADLNGDGKADILWQHTDGRVAAWTMNGTTPISGAVLMGPATGWSITQMADFNGDGNADILWKHTDGRIAIWQMVGFSITDAGVIFGPGPNQMLPTP